jgi:hypothetical protein
MASVLPHLRFLVQVREEEVVAGQEAVVVAVVAEV